MIDERIASAASTRTEFAHDRTSMSTDSFEEMYRANLVFVYRYATSRLGTDDGEDVVAEVSHAAALSYKNGRGTTVTTPWLMSVTRNKVIDHWRRAGRRAARDSILRSRERAPVGLPAHWHHDERRPAVLAALNRCSSRHRAYLIMHYVDGMPAPEIASSLGVSTSSVESMLARARRAFQKYYDPEEA